ELRSANTQHSCGPLISCIGSHVRTSGAMLRRSDCLAELLLRRLRSSREPETDGESGLHLGLHDRRFLWMPAKILPMQDDTVGVCQLQPHAPVPPSPCPAPTPLPPGRN